MEDDVATLLSNYQDRPIDETFYKELYKILAEYYGINECFLGGVEVLSRSAAQTRFKLGELGSVLTKAFFNEKDNKIYIIPENHDIDTSKLDDPEFKDFSDGTHMLFSNLLKVRLFLHEFEHLVQKAGKDGIEGELINACPSYTPNELYVYSPMERLANLYSSLQTLKIAKILNLPPQAIKEIKHDMFIFLYDPYFYNDYEPKRINKERNEPVNEFFARSKINMPISPQFVSRLSLTERIIYGLSISKEENSQLQDTIWNLDCDEMMRILQRNSKCVNSRELVIPEAQSTYK